MNTRVYSAIISGIEANLLEIEIQEDEKREQSLLNILGFPYSSARESKERIFSSIKNIGIDIPKNKFILNFYPAVYKYPKSYDLPIAIGVLINHKHLDISEQYLRETLIIGELSLNGNVRGVKGILPIAHKAAQMGIKRLIIPKENKREAVLAENINIICVDNLLQVIKFLDGEINIKPLSLGNVETKLFNFEEDFSDIKGHELAKRALQISAAGRHNVIMVGSPGSGKTMLAKRLKTIMPPMTTNEIIETSKIYSISTKNDSYDLINNRPYREPHHTSSPVGLIGGGKYIEPGEISLAHNGILFLDEFAEYPRSTLEALRQPIESGIVSISRANLHVTYPSQFILVAALNPCPCGYSGDSRHKCTCSFSQIQSYFEKMSGPILDRIDLQLIVNPIDIKNLQNTTKQTSSEDLRKSVLTAYEIQMKRGKYNGLMTPKEMDLYCKLDSGGENLLKIAYNKLKLSSRSYHKVLKISRTIADLDNKELIDVNHIKEALMYRAIDKKLRESNESNN